MKNNTLKLSALITSGIFMLSIGVAQAKPDLKNKTTKEQRQAAWKYCEAQAKEKNLVKQEKKAFVKKCWTETLWGKK